MQSALDRAMKETTRSCLVIAHRCLDASIAMSQYSIHNLRCSQQQRDASMSVSMSMFIAGTRCDGAHCVLRVQFLCRSARSQELLMSPC